MSTGPPPPDPLVGFIQMLSSALNSSIHRPEQQSLQFPAWYLTLRSVMDSLMSRPVTASTPSTRETFDSLKPFLASLTGISEAELESLVRNILYPRSVETPTPLITDADFARPQPEDIVEHEEEPAQKRVRHE